MTSGLREFVSRVHAANPARLVPMLEMRRRYRLLSLPRTSAAPAIRPPNQSSSVGILRTEEELAAFQPRWQALFETAQCRLPFLHFSWIQQWWRAFGASNPLVRNQLEILIVEDAGRLLGILPLYQTTYGAGRAFGMRYVRPIGSDANLTEVHTALVLPGHEEAVAAAVERFFAGCEHAWDLINWGSHPEHFSPGSNVPGHWFSARQAPVEMFVVDVPPTWDAFAASWKRNTKESVRKARNALKRDGRVTTFRCLTCTNDILAVLPRFYELHRLRSEQKSAVPHPDMFSRRAHRRFMTGLTHTMADADILKMFVLDVDGTSVAMRLGFVIGDALYCYYSGFDPAFSRYSVMTRLQVELMRWAVDTGLLTINLSTGRDQAKLRWNPRALEFHPYSQIGSRFRSRLTFALFARA